MRTNLAICYIVALTAMCACTEENPGARDGIAGDDVGSDTGHDVEDDRIADDTDGRDDVEDRDAPDDAVDPEDVADDASDTVNDDAPGDATDVPDDLSDDAPDAPDTADAPDAPGDGTIEIYLAGDLTQRTYDDGLSGQTPRDYFIALSEYQVAKSLGDNDPQPCFRHDAPMEFDLHGDNLAGRCRTADIDSGLYTHGRVRVDWVRYTVDGVLHTIGREFPGEFTFFHAYSDALFEGRMYRAGQGFIRYDGVTEFQIPTDLGNALPTLPGLRLETIDGQFWMTFPFGRPLPIATSDTSTHWARFHWEIYEAFRWQDIRLQGYAAGEWDVAPPPGPTEQVIGLGVSGYHVTTSVD